MPKPVNDVVAYKLQRHIVEGLEARKDRGSRGGRAPWRRDSRAGRERGLSARWSL